MGPRGLIPSIRGLVDCVPFGTQGSRPQGGRRGERAGARCRSRGILSELNESPLTIPKKNSGRDFDFPPRPTLKRPKERPAGLSFGNLSGVTGDFYYGGRWDGGRRMGAGCPLSFRGPCLTKDECEDGSVVLAPALGGYCPPGDGGRHAESSCPTGDEGTKVAAKVVVF